MRLSDKKKHTTNKKLKESLFIYKLFIVVVFTYRGRKRRREEGEEKKKVQYTHRTNSNLPGESIAREKEKVLLFINRGKSPLFYKKQYQK